MTLDQILVVATLGAALGFFAWGYWRHDIVAIFALLALVFLGIVPAEEAYAGFAHPAVITVAAMLVISAALEESGIVEMLARSIGTTVDGEFLTLTLLVGVVTLLSAFMNNVGALVLMMPVTLAISARKDIPPARLLMPVAFGSILGGLMTLIGTPPNIIVSAYRADAVGTPFSLFEFAPVGMAVALAGVAATIAFSRLFLSKETPSGKKPSADYIDSYLTEVALPDGSVFQEQSVGEIEEIGQGDVNVLGVIREGVTMTAPKTSFALEERDILVLEAEPSALRELLNATGLELTGEHHLDSENLGDVDGEIVEAVLMPRTTLEGQNLRNSRLHARHGVNVLAIARRGQTVRERLGRIRFRVGDLILVQGEASEMGNTLHRLGCMPVSGNSIEVQNFSFVPLLVFSAALLASALKLIPIHISLVAAAALVVATRYLSLRKVYDSIDWSVIVLLAAMVPVGQSLKNTGTTSLIATGMLSLLSQLPDAAIIAALIVFAIVLSNIVNNAATAILMAPLSIEIASGLGFGPDPFLMAVAIGSSCAFILPIGHQSNLLVMGPGGYRFSDFIPLGTLATIAAVIAAVPAILFFWPLSTL